MLADFAATTQMQRARLPNLIQKITAKTDFELDLPASMLISEQRWTDAMDELLDILMTKRGERRTRPPRPTSLF
jgi:thioredoxin-like negative regulator of GroEL